MEDLMLTGGSTPFEVAAARRLVAHKQLTVMYATNELVKLIQECNVMLQQWQEEVATGRATHETRSIAAEAMKDKRAAERALEELMKNADALGFSD